MTKIKLQVPMSEEATGEYPTVHAKYIPQVGTKFGLMDLELAFELVRTRMEHFPSEPANIALATVLVNMGDRYTPVACVEGEWTGIKEDLIGMDPPMCPQGHDVRTQAPLQLIWAQEIPDGQEIEG